MSRDIQSYTQLSCDLSIYRQETCCNVLLKFRRASTEGAITITITIMLVRNIRIGASKTKRLHPVEFELSFFGCPRQWVACMRSNMVDCVP